MYAGPAGRVAVLVGLLFGRVVGVKVWVGLLLGKIVGLGRMVGVAVGVALHCGHRSRIARVACVVVRAFLGRMGHKVGQLLGVGVVQGLLCWWWRWAHLALCSPQKW
jgi:hypothetical protein